MTKVMRVLRSKALRCIGAGALSLTALLVTSSMKWFVFHQPELPKELIEEKEA